MFFDKVAIFFSNFWNKSIKKEKLKNIELFFFYILCVLEFCYRLAFAVIIFLKKNKAKAFFNFKVISVGNLSVGGTGKSVFVKFLVNRLKDNNPALKLSSLPRLRRTGRIVVKVAIVLRGYKSLASQKKDSLLVCDGKKIMCKACFCGDEAYMFADSLRVPVVVGKRRDRSCKILDEKFNNLDFVIFDDAYQNFLVKKDFEVLLLDARKPLENGHCLPAGRLREKDYSRADVIVLTHANLVSKNNLKNIKNILLSDFDSNKIFSGKHKFDGFYKANLKHVDLNNIKNEKFLVFAGIGSFDNFIATVKNQNIDVANTIEYKDHFDYQKKDINYILSIIKKNKLDGAITTEKDWVKIKNFFNQKDSNFLEKIYVLRIGFEFLTKEEEELFFSNKIWE